MAETAPVPDLHSTMFLLIPGTEPDNPASVHIYIPQCFY